VKRISLASAQSLAADQHAILIGIKVFTRIEGDAAEGDGDVAVAGALLDAFLRVGVEGADADFHAIDVDRIADAAVDDDAFPAVLVSQDGELVADQRAAQRPAAVDDQYLAAAAL